MRKLLPILLLSTTATAVWADPENGKELHDPECMGCHSTEVYTRGAKGKVTDFTGLKRMVSMCITNTGKGADWFPEDQEEVIEYMNQEFYHLKP